MEQCTACMNGCKTEKQMKGCPLYEFTLFLNENELIVVPDKNEWAWNIVKRNNNGRS